MYADVQREQDQRSQVNWGALAGAAAVGLVAGLAANAGRKAAVQAISTGAATDWFEALRNEHRQIEKVMEALTRTGPGDRSKREAMFKALKFGLQKHAVEEETVIYPALRMSGMSNKSKELVDDHADIKTGLLELERMRTDDPRWLDALRDLQRVVVQHIREEEEQIYPNFQNKISREENQQISKLMHIEGAKYA